MDKLHKNKSRQRSNKPLRFLVGGVSFGNHNVGDEAILEGAVNILKKIQPNCEITVLTDQPRYTAKKLGVKAFKYQFIVPSSGKINILFRMISRVFENLLQAYLATRSDVVVCAGATILSDSPEFLLRFASWAIFSNKRLVQFPVGMNAGNSPETLNKLLAISNYFDLFLARDIDTKKRLVDAGFPPNFVQVTVDPAFNIELVNDANLNIIPMERVKNNKNLVGIGISHEPDCLKYNQPSEWARIADFVVENFNANVVFIPSNTEEGKDLIVMRAAQIAMLHKESAYVIDNELSPKDMISAISQFEMMISSRMHQLIFSAIAETVFVGISRCDKIDSFLSLFNMIPATNVSDCTLEKIRPSLESAWKQRDHIKERIKNKKGLLLAKASETEYLFANFLDSMKSDSKVCWPLLVRSRSFLKAFLMRL